MKVAVAVLPDRDFPEVAEAVKKGAAKNASDADVMIREMVVVARERYTEQMEEGKLPLFLPGSSVSNKTAYGYRVYSEILLCTAKDLAALTGKPVNSLQVTPIKIKLDGESYSKFFPLSMQGLSEEQVRGIKRMQIYHELEVEHEESFLAPEHQLHEQHGANSFQFYTKKHFAARPGAARVGGKPYELSKIIQDAEMQEAKNAATVAAVAAASARKQPQKPKRDSDESEGSTGSESEDKDQDPATAKPKARAAPTPSLGSLQSSDLKKVIRKPKAAALRRSPSPDKAPSSSAAAKPKSVTLGGSKKDKELAAQLRDLEEHDTEMHRVATEHLRHAKGSSIGCLKQLNVQNFLTNTKQGQVLHAVSCPV